MGGRGVLVLERNIAILLESDGGAAGVKVSNMKWGIPLSTRAILLSSVGPIAKL